MDTPLYTLEELENSSNRKELNFEADSEKRRNFCRFIQTAGLHLQLPQRTVALAQILFHRFFTIESYDDHNLYTTSRICLVVACKVHEVKRRLRDIINVLYALQNPNSPTLSVGQRYFDLKCETVEKELEFMNILKFKLDCVVPQQILLLCASHLSLDSNITRLAWAITNDTLQTLACMLHSPIEIAVASIFLASRMLSEPIPNAKDRWWQAEFEVYNDAIESVCSSVLDLYESPTAQFLPSIGSNNILPDGGDATKKKYVRFGD